MALSSSPSYLLAVRGKHVLAAVEVQQHQPPGRMPEVVHAGNRLLAPVAALGEVHGGLDPADLVRNRPVIGVGAEPGPVPGDPQRLVRPHASQAHALGAVFVRRLGELAALHELVGGEAEVHHDRGVQAGWGERPRDGQHREVRADIGGVDSEHEPH